MSLMLPHTSQTTRSIFIAFVLGFLTACGGGGGGGGGSSTTTASVTANISSETSTSINQSVTFSGSSSTATGTTITSWEWTFDGTESASGATVSKTFTTAGTHPVTLTVADANGITDTAQVSIIVTAPNAAPTAAFTPTSSTVFPAVALTFDASSSSDSDGSIATYQWDFGDSTTESSSNSTITKTYNSIGTYTVSLVTVDDDGQSSAATTGSVEVIAQTASPFVSYSVTQTADNTLAFSVVPQSALGSISGYSWSFGDGGSTNTTFANTSYVYSTAGPFTVNVTANISGGTSSDSFTTPTVESDLKRIIAIGDSITEGYNGARSFRYNLWSKLVDGDYTFDLIGTETALDSGSSCSTTQCPDITQTGSIDRVFVYDQHHEAESGIRADQINARLNTTLSNSVYNNGADIAIVHLGTNDIIQGRTPADTVADLQGIIDKLQVKFPTIRILIAEIIPLRSDWPNFDQVDDLNLLINNLEGTNTNVTVVDQYTDFNIVTMLSDGVHPNTTGEDEIASDFFDAIVASGIL